MKQSKSFLKIPTNRIIALVLLDVISTLIASFVAIYIRFDFSFEKIEKGYFTSLEHILIPNAVFTLVFFVIWKLYKSVWRYASTNELINILGATVSTTIAQVIYCSFTGNKMPRSYPILYLFILAGLTCLIRFGYRILRLINNKRASIVGRKTGVNVMIIGAGAAANMILKEIEASDYLNLQAKCVIDDNDGCHGKLLRGVPIVGGRDKILDAVQQ